MQVSYPVPQINLIQSLSRLPSSPVDPRNAVAKVQDQEKSSQNEESAGTSWGVNKAAGLWIHGRYILNLWRMTRSEVGDVVIFPGDRVDVNEVPHIMLCSWCS